MKSEPKPRELPPLTEAQIEAYEGIRKYGPAMLTHRSDIGSHVITLADGSLEIPRYRIDALVRRGLVRPNNDGLLPGDSQSWSAA